MALDKTLKIYDEQGNEVDYDILAKDVKFLPDGKDLPTKLAELEDEIGEGGYTPPVGGIPKTDLAPDVQTSLGKADTALQSADKNELQSAINSLQSALDTLIGSGNVQGAIDTFNEVVAFLNGIDTDDPTLFNQLKSLSDAITALQTLLAGKANSADVVPNSRTINGKPLSSDVTIGMSDIQGLVDAINNAGGNVSVIQPDPADGTFIIRVGSTDYTVNLNHTHENMAKLVVCEESELPSTLEEDTIYGVEEDGEISVLYVGGIPFYGGGGGGTSTPVLRQPTDGSTIDVGKIASGESSVTKTITVKGKNLTQALTVAVTGTGYSVNKQSIPAADANVGTTLIITCTSTAEEAAGTLSIASSEVSCDCDLVANIPTYEDLRGVKLTGSQWLQTDYKPNANTEFRLTCRFEERSDTHSASKSAYEGYIFGCEKDASNKLFGVRSMTVTGDNYYNPWNIGFVNETGIMYNNDYQIIPIGNDANTRPYISVDPVQIYYTKGSSNGTIGFTDGTHTLTKPTSLKTSTQGTYMMIGHAINNGTAYTYSVWDLTIYSLVITENGNEVHHWVPKMKNGTIPGLYDTVTGTFISSETSTELVAVN